VPLLAVQRDDSGKTMALVGTARTRYTSASSSSASRGSLLAEVKSGLEQGDRVVLGNAARYRDGEQITPRMEQQPANDVMHEEGGMTDPQADAQSGQGGN
jgi:hypothetical protein